MRRLLRVELMRLRLRRAVLLLVLAAIAVPAVVLVARVLDTRPIDEAQVLADNSYAVEDCLDHPRRYDLPRDAAETMTPEDLTARCEATVVDWYSWYEPLTLAGERAGGGLVVIALLTAAMFLLGTTFVGHDWNSGSMSNQLLFESRRERIWGAKAVVVTLVGLLVSAVVLAGYFLVVRAVMASRDVPVLDHALRDTLAYGARAALFVAAAGLGGYVLTMLFRSTVATVGVLFVVAVVSSIFIGALGIGERWQPPKNVSAIVNNGTEYWVTVPERCWREDAEAAGPPAEGSECDDSRELSLAGGAAYWGLPLLLAAGLSVGSFRRRDVP